MSVNISSPVQKYIDKREPCLCTQDSDAFYDVMDQKVSISNVEKELAEAANSKCYSCEGTGIEGYSEPLLPEMNLANDNARILFSILKIDIDQMESSIPEIKRGLIRAQNQDLSRWVRDEEKLYGEPTEREDGLIEMRPLRAIKFGLTKEKLDKYLNALRYLVKVHEEKGASKLIWS